MSEYGETLARYRDEAGLSQRELGAAIGLDYTQLNKIEHGHRPPLRAKYMKPLARALRLKKCQAEKLVDLAGLSRKVLDFMDEGAANQAVKSKQQALPPPMATTPNPALALPDSLLDTIEEESEEIKRLIVSTSLTAEEEKMVKSVLLDTTKQLLKFIETQRKMRKER